MMETNITNRSSVLAGLEEDDDVMKKEGHGKERMASSEGKKHGEVIAIELPAPAGWVKKFTPRMSNTPQKNDIIFTSPTGEEIKNKRQLEQYLKSHAGGPVISDFDWGTGSPRRSARLSRKSKAVEASESEPPKKKQKTSGRKGRKEKDTAAGKTKESLEISMEHTKSVGSAEVVDRAPCPKPIVDEVNKDTKTEEALEEPSSVEYQSTEHLTTEIMTWGVPFTEVSVLDVEVSKDVPTKAADVKVDESAHGENESPGGKVEDAETCLVDEDGSLEKQAAEKPSEKEPIVQEPNAGVGSSASVKGYKSEPCTKFFSASGCPLKGDCPMLHDVPGGIITVTEQLGFNPAIPNMKLRPGSELYFGIPEFPWDPFHGPKVEAPKFIREWESRDKFLRKLYNRRKVVAASPWMLFPPNKKATRDLTPLMWDMGGGWLFPCMVFPWEKKESSPSLGCTTLENSSSVEQTTDRTAASDGEFAFTEKVQGPLTSSGAYINNQFNLTATLLARDFDEDSDFSWATKIACPLADAIARGRHLKLMSQLTGAQIVLQDQDDSDPNWRGVEIKGSIQQTASAGRMLVDLINYIVVDSRLPPKKIVKFGDDPTIEAIVF